jgi:hypothetical protein
VIAAKAKSPSQPGPLSFENPGSSKTKVFAPLFSKSGCLLRAIHVFGALS